MYCGYTIRGDNPNRRWQNGCGYLNKHNGEYVQRLFARAILKYGWDNFNHEIIASNLTESEAKNFETIVIDKLKLRNPNFGYNLTNGGEGTKGWTISEETRQKFRDRQKGKSGELSPRYGKKHTKESREKISRSHKEKTNEYQRIKICQYTKQGEFVNEFEYSGVASEQTGISRSSIENCLCKLSKTAGGYIWRRSNEKLTDEDIVWVNSRKQHARKNSLQTEQWFDKKSKKYKVRFKKDGKYVCCKTYLTKEEADTAVYNYKNNKESW
jgi:group I intron endonuclease